MAHSQTCTWFLQHNLHNPIFSAQQLKQIFEWKLQTLLKGLLALLLCNTLMPNCSVTFYFYYVKHIRAYNNSRAVFVFRGSIILYRNWGNSLNTMFFFSSQLFLVNEFSTADMCSLLQCNQINLSNAHLFSMRINSSSHHNPTDRKIVHSSNHWQWKWGRKKTIA